MLKQNGAFSAIQIASGLDVRRGMRDASQQVRHYDMTPPPVMPWGIQLWRQLVPSVFNSTNFSSPMPAVVPAVGVATTPPVWPTARALAPDRIQQRNRLVFLAPVRSCYSSGALG